MIPRKTTLQGSLGILAGMGKDTITIDWDALIPEHAITVALRGDNGSGKSTILNLGLVPWREPSILDGTLYDEFGEKGMRVLEFTHCGFHYRSTIKIRRTKKTKKMDAFLHVLDEVTEEWNPYLMPDHTTSDGKGGTYDACLEHLLGPQSIYYLSAFRGQGAPRLAEYDDPKQLMRDLLGLDRPEKLRLQSKEVIKELNRAMVSRLAERDNLAFKAGQVKEHSETLETYRELTPTLNQEKVNTHVAIVIARTEYQEATQQEGENLKVQQARQEMQARINKATAAGNDSITRAAHARDAATARYGDVTGDANNRVMRSNQMVNNVKRRQAEAQQLLSQRNEIAAAAAQAVSVTKDIDAKETELTLLEKHMSRLNELTQEGIAVSAEVEICVSTGKSINEELLDLEKRSAFVQVVPCKGQGEYAACPALLDAMGAKAKAAETQLHIERVREQYKKSNKALKALQADIEGMGDVKERNINTRVAMSALRQELVSMQAIAAKGAAMDQAQKTVDGCVDELADLEHQREQLDLETKAKAEAAKQEMHEAEVAVNKATVEKITEVGNLDALLAAMPEPDAESVLAAAKMKLANAEQAISAADEAAQVNIRRIAVEEGAIQGLQADVDAGADVMARATRISDQLAVWKRLAEGLQGVIDLSIEDAGPGIAATANQLLKDSFGPQFTMSIISQRELANGDLVEDFDILVTDGQSGLDARILKKSGGQQVWMDKALTDAVGIHHQESTGMHSECQFSDEAEDGLTRERKNQFYQMDRLALAAGGYERKYFVSHHPDAWEYADCVIDMGELA